jgi:hypothetical protein
MTALQNLSEINTVKLIWVPGHINVLGNEEADRLLIHGDLLCRLFPKTWVNCWIIIDRLSMIAELRVDL